MHIVVLGAGLAGLSTTWTLCRSGHRVTLCEKQDHVGGMASSWKVGPYWLDFGPHRFHSLDEGLIAHLYEILDDEVVIRERKSRIYLEGKFFDYPLELTNVLAGLPAHTLARALADYLWIRVSQWFKPIPDSHFENWVIKRFGRTLYDLFFGTYTSKAWGMPCTEISADWAAQRISQANLWDTIVKTIKAPREGEVRSLVTRFWYPARGGVGQIARKYAEKIRAMGGDIRLGCAVERIDVEHGRATRVHAVREGTAQVIDCDRIVNTIPVPHLLRALQPLPGGEQAAAEAAQAAANLRYIGIVFVYLEVDRPSVLPDHWVYLPSKQLTIHRMTEFKNFSDGNAPGCSTVVCCEITCRPGDEHWRLDLEQAARIAERDLVRIGLLPEGLARPLTIARLPQAYPVYDLSYRHNLGILSRAISRVGNLHTTGRQGLYRYNNMDHSIAMGRKVAQAIDSGLDAGAEAVATGVDYFG